MNEQARLPFPNRDRPLQEIIEEFGERVRSGGPYGEIDEWSVYDESFRRLVEWAIDTGCFYEGSEPLKEGGREHDLTFDSASGSWIKFTKPSCAGYVVSFETGMPALEPGLPLEYLQRLILQNELFSDQINFVGIGGSKRQPRIMTRQPDIIGEAAEDEEIIRMMTRDLDFKCLEPRFSVGYQDSLAFVRGDVAVFDLRSANVVRTEQGLIIPIDAIPVRLDAGAKGILGV